MTCAGARGDTAREIARTLHWRGNGERLHSPFAASPQSEANRGYQLVMANQLVMINGLFGQKDFGFLPDFVTLARRECGADLKEVDFTSSPEKACQAINAWVTRKTGPKITDLLRPEVVDSETCLMLVNAIYFSCGSRAGRNWSPGVQRGCICGFSASIHGGQVSSFSRRDRNTMARS
jgi:serpin B